MLDQRILITENIESVENPVDLLMSYLIEQSERIHPLTVAELVLNDLQNNHKEFLLPTSRKGARFLAELIQYLGNYGYFDLDNVHGVDNVHGIFLTNQNRIVKKYNKWIFPINGQMGFLNVIDTIDPTIKRVPLTNLVKEIQDQIVLGNTIKFVIE